MALIASKFAVLGVYGAGLSADRSSNIFTAAAKLDIA